MEDNLRHILTRFSQIIGERKRPEGHVARSVANFARSLNMEAHVQTDENNRRRALIRSTPAATRSFLNGVIVDESRVLVLPPKQLKRIEYRNISELHNMKLSRYRVTEAANGTMVTLYCWDNQWCLGTTRGIYVNDYAIVGAQSLMKIFISLIGKYTVVGDDGEQRPMTLNDFDRNVSYTFIMCHPDYHVLPIESLYFIRAFSITRQDIIDCPMFLVGLQQQEVVFDGTAMSAKVNYFTSRCIGATQRFMSGNMQQVSGFILRAEPGVGDDRVRSRSLKAGDRVASGKPSDHTSRISDHHRVISDHASDYYVESDITHFLQRFVYQSLRSTVVEPKFRRMHFILHVYLNSSFNSSLYDIIKARYASEFDVLDSTFAAIQKMYATFLETGSSPSIIAFDNLFSAMRKDSVDSADIRNPAYFELLFKLLMHLRNVSGPAVGN